MKLNVNRLLSDRIVSDPSSPGQFRIANSFWDWCKRIISWIWSPGSYSDENRRTIACFKNCLINSLGAERLQRICSRYSLDLNAMEKKGSPLLSRDIAKIVIGAKNVSVEDVNGFLKKSQQAGDPRFAGRNSFLDLDSEALASIVARSNRPLGDDFEVPDVAKQISGRPTETIARFFYDPFLADRERLQVSRENPSDSFDVFMHNMVARVIKREMDVGTLVPAPNHPNGTAQFYYVSGKVVTGEGMVSYIFHPATRDTNLEPIRLFRGTSARNSEIDGVSTVITDLERDLGRSAYESGLIYEPTIRERLTQPTIEGGHSLGSALVEYRVANMDHIRKAYLFCGPGIPEREVEKFNAKNLPIELVIRQATQDKWCTVGQVHLGYRAPSNVQVNFLKYHTPRKNFNQSSHVAVFGRERGHYGIEGGISREELDAYFVHKNGTKERLRSTFGPTVAYVLRALRNWCRCRISNRADTERGLKIGHMQDGRWQVDHFRTID